MLGLHCVTGPPCLALAGHHDQAAALLVSWIDTAYTVLHNCTATVAQNTAGTMLKLCAPSCTLCCFGPDHFCSATTRLWPCRYLAGWGYVVSWDSMQHVISKADLYAEQPMLAPKWYAGLHWEDVMIGLLLNDYATFQPHGGEYSAIGRALQYPAVTGCTHAAAMASLCEAKQTAAQACAAAVLQAATCSSTYTCCTVCRHQGSLEVL